MKKIFYSITLSLLLISCNSNSKSSIEVPLIQEDSAKHDNTFITHEEILNNLETDNNITVIKRRYPKEEIRCLISNQQYYSVIPSKQDENIRLIKVEDGIIIIDKEFPKEYRNINVIKKRNNRILIGINWVYQCKIITLTSDLDIVNSKIYNIPDGEWTELDSLDFISNDSYYAEIRTGCNDCGEGINKYTIKAYLNHKIISSSVEPIGEYKVDTNKL